VATILAIPQPLTGGKVLARLPAIALATAVGKWCFAFKLWFM
jgi:hypothetical protein